jgi:hypothetical protein
MLEDQKGKRSMSVRDVREIGCENVRRVEQSQGETKWRTYY